MSAIHFSRGVLCLVRLDERLPSTSEAEAFAGALTALEREYGRVLSALTAVAQEDQQTA
jgi:hypothetical protein